MYFIFLFFFEFHLRILIYFYLIWCMLVKIVQQLLFNARLEWLILINCGDFFFLGTTLLEINQ